MTAANLFVTRSAWDPHGRPQAPYQLFSCSDGAHPAQLAAIIADCIRLHQSAEEVNPDQLVKQYESCIRMDACYVYAIDLVNKHVLGWKSGHPDYTQFTDTTRGLKSQLTTLLTQTELEPYLPPTFTTNSATVDSATVESAAVESAAVEPEFNIQPFVDAYWENWNALDAFCEAGYTPLTGLSNSELIAFLHRLIPPTGYEVNPIDQDRLYTLFAQQSWLACGKPVRIHRAGVEFHTKPDPKTGVTGGRKTVSYLNLPSTLIYSILSAAS